jgi:hypothetical protein
LKITTKKVNLSEIKLNPDNPRSISKKDMELLVKSLKEFPEMLQLREIVVDEQMTCLGGNMRYRAMKKIGEKECLVKIVSGLTLEQKREFILKDNASFGEWDMDALANAWGDLPLVDFGVDIPKAWGDLPTGETKEKDAGPEKPSIILCPKCGHEFSVLKKEK